MRRALAITVWLFALVAGVGVPVYLMVEQDPGLALPVGIVAGVIVLGLVALVIGYKRRGRT